jgi:hypothetical protein
VENSIRDGVGSTPLDMHFPITSRKRRYLSETGYPLTWCHAIYVSKCINCRPIRRTAFDGGPTGDYPLVFAKRLQYVSVPDGSDVAVPTRFFRFFLERAERRIMPSTVTQM